MKLDRRCFPCILNQVLRMGKALGLDDARIDTVFDRALDLMAAAGFDRNQSAPEFAEGVYDGFIEAAGTTDPYHPLRQRQNRMILDRLDLYRNRIVNSGDPLFAAALYALTGNIIDFGAMSTMDEAPLFAEKPDDNLDVNDYPLFRRRLHEAGTVLVIGDNAGEVVFDRLLLEQMARMGVATRFFYAVRSKPIINDVVAEDAEAAGIGAYAEVIESGSSFAGTVLAKTNSRFRSVYETAGLVISKGQGNYETLEGEPGDPLFIFQVKCLAVAEHTGLPLGARVLGFASSIGADRGV
jgi:uncharacterized protein with ATP-grasp and redox domains